MRLWDLKTGIQLRRFNAYSGVSSVAVLPSGTRALCGCDNGGIKLWDLGTGAEVGRFPGHEGGVLSIAVLANGRQALSGGHDNVLCLWDLETGDEPRVFKGHRSDVWPVEALPDGLRALSGSDDRTLRLWDLKTGTELRSFEGHSSYVRAVQTLPDGRQALSGSADRTIRLWDLATGAELRCFEGHWGSVNAVAVLPSGRRALSCSSDKTVRLWDVETGAELRRFEGHTGEVWSIALSPDGRQALSGSSDGTVRLWDVEAFGEDADTVGYTTARIALLGDSGVGKTALGWRIAHGEFREQASTHGQQFWVIDKLGSTRSDGTQCEAVLWDLAGQPDYRLIHALFLDRVDLGLLLFDAANRERPLAGIEYWVRHLRSATLRPVAIGQSPLGERLRASAPTLLIAARSDRGTPTLNLGDIEEFCRGKDIGGYTVTSAREDIGVSELIDKIKATVSWDHLTATTTTRTFKRIKEHVLKLKELSDREILLRPDELRRQLEQCGSEWRFSDAEMMTAVGHLANHGYVIQLKRASGEEAILLAPDLFKNLASSIVLEARRHERGLGLVDEARLLGGDYPLPELASITPDVATTLLDAIAGLFLQRNLCFRETINDRTCLVFPSLINERRPPAGDPGFTDDVSYSVSGAVETVYAALVVQLGCTNLFRRDHHWQNQAQYELEPGETCGFRLSAESDGEIELVLSYSGGAGDDTHKLFQGAVERFLKRRPVQIGRLPSVTCAQAHVQERAAVRKAITDGRPFFFCDICGAKLSTPGIDDIGMPTPQHAAAVLEAEETADRRTSYEVALAWVKAFRRDRGNADKKPSCFISYAWGDPGHERWVERLADRLQNADVLVTLDKWHNPPGAAVSRFIERIAASDFVCSVGTPLYLRKDKTQNTDPVVQAELRLIKSKLMKRDGVHDTVIPLLREGTLREAFPPLLQDSVFIDFRLETDFFVRLFDLMLTIHRVPFDNEMSRQHRDELVGASGRKSRTGFAKHQVHVSLADGSARYSRRH